MRAGGQAEDCSFEPKNIQLVKRHIVGKSGLFADLRFKPLRACKGHKHATARAPNPPCPPASLPSPAKTNELELPYLHLHSIRNFSEMKYPARCDRTRPTDSGRSQKPRCLDPIRLHRRADVGCKSGHGKSSQHRGPHSQSTGQKRAPKNQK